MRARSTKQMLAEAAGETRPPESSKPPENQVMLWVLWGLLLFAIIMGVGYFGTGGSVGTSKPDCLAAYRPVSCRATDGIRNSVRPTWTELNAEAAAARREWAELKRCAPMMEFMVDEPNLNVIRGDAAGIRMQIEAVRGARSAISSAKRRLC